MCSANWTRSITLCVSLSFTSFWYYPRDLDIRQNTSKWVNENTIDSLLNICKRKGHLQFWFQPSSILQYCLKMYFFSGLFHLNIHGGGGVERSPIKKSWGEGVKIKKNHWARGLSNIEKHGAGESTWQKKKHRVWGIYYIYWKVAGRVPRHCHKMLYTPSWKWSRMYPKTQREQTLANFSQWNLELGLFEQTFAPKLGIKAL